MQLRVSLILAAFLCTLLLISGCGTSEESQTGEESAPAVREERPDLAPAPEQKPAENQRANEETAPAAREEQPAPAPARETAGNIDASMPTGKFSVQVGAFSLPEKAQMAASAARSRFSKNVYMMRDANSGNTKVMVGDFAVKDDARRFRDQIIQQYPDDYKDAWVFEVPHQ